MRDDCTWGTDGFRLKIPNSTNLISSCLLSGYGAMMRIVRTEVRTPVISKIENHYNFVMAQPLVNTIHQQISLCPNLKKTQYHIEMVNSEKCNRLRI